MTAVIPKVKQGTTLAKAGRVGDQSELFESPDRQPTDKEQRVMLGLALAKATNKCLGLQTVQRWFYWDRDHRRNQQVIHAEVGPEVSVRA